MKTISLDSISDRESPEEKVLAEQIQAGRVAIISWLGLGRKPSGQVAERLRRLGFSESVAGAVMTSLQADGYLDDDTLARRTVRQRQGRQAESQAALAHRLRRQGYSEEAIAAVLPADTQDLTNAIQLLQNRFARQISLLAEQEADLSWQEFAAERRSIFMKAGRFLAGRGFGPAIINQALAALLPGIDSEGFDQA